MGYIRIVNPNTGQVVIEEMDDGTIKYMSEELKQAMEEKLQEGEVPAGEELARLIEEIEEAEKDLWDENWQVVEGVVPYSSGPLDDSGSWDAAAARAKLAKWASSDGSGNKDKINWSKYARGFLIIDGDKENFGSYKYPHHVPKNGTLYVVWGGVKTAMGFLMRTSPPNKREAYNHLKKHYRAFGKEAPPFKEEAYTEDEWRNYLASIGELDE